MNSVCPGARAVRRGDLPRKKFNICSFIISTVNAATYVSSDFQPLLPSKTKLKVALFWRSKFPTMNLLLPHSWSRTTTLHWSVTEQFPNEIRENYKDKLTKAGARSKKKNKVPAAADSSQEGPDSDVLCAQRQWGKTWLDVITVKPNSWMQKLINSVLIRCL